MLLVYVIFLEGDKGLDLCGVGMSFCVCVYGFSIVGLVDCKFNILYNVFYIMKYS